GLVKFPPDVSQAPTELDFGISPGQRFIRAKAIALDRAAKAAGFSQTQNANKLLVPATQLPTVMHSPAQRIKHRPKIASRRFACSELKIFDGFLGSNYLDAIYDRADSHIVKFIARVYADSSKRFILLELP
ncbi:hypothetical protein OAL00_04135, partial [Verrucomicrobiales bacterium]|nr:hypothetical protein [Verrucomicrobiales bacterium]